MEYTLQSSALTVRVSALGAELQSIRDGAGIEYLWQGDPTYWRSRAIQLFPCVGRLTEDSYLLDGQRYTMNRHGFARNGRFCRLEGDDGRITLELTDTPETLTAYPRRFAFRVIYALQASTLTVTYEVEDRDKRAMCFGLGGHPGFRVPLTEGRRFEDYRLRFSESCSPRRILFSPDCFLSGDDQPFPLIDGKYLPLRHDLFDNDAIVLADTPREVTLEAAGDGRAVTVFCPQMPYLGFWHTPHSNAPFVCIEPWVSLPARQGVVDDLAQRPDLVSLQPGEVYQNIWSIRINTTP